MTKSRAVLMSILFAGLTWLGYQKYQDHSAAQQSLADSVRGYKRAHESYEHLLLEQSHQQGGEFNDTTSNSIPATYPRPQSEWFLNEQQWYARQVTGHPVEVVVVPLQIFGWGFDRATRSLMTAQLASAVERAMPGKVLDPYVAAKVMGDGLRELKLEEIYRLAESVQARQIIWGAVGHDRHGHLRVIIMQARRGDKTSPGNPWSQPPTRTSFADASFTDERSPLDAFGSLIPRILNFAGIPVGPQLAVTSEAALDVTQLPASPLNLLSSPSNTARDAYTFLLFAALTPTRIERTRERFAEKAFLATSGLSTIAPEYKALRARALMMLGYRIAALTALGQPKSNEELELSAVLNGNLTEARALTSQENNKIKQLIEQLDANQLAASYDVVESAASLDAVKTLRLPGEVWPFLAVRAFTDWDPWSDFTNASLKMVLDRDFPLTGYALQDLVRGQVAVGDPERLRQIVNLSVHNHTQQYLHQNAEKWCCSFQDGAHAADYIELLSAIGHDNLLRHLEFLAKMQASPQRAMEYADSIQSIYKGHPYYSLVRSEAERLAAERSSGAERDGLNTMAYTDAFNAFYWEQGQSIISSKAFDDIAFETLNAYPIFENLYSSDIPYHPLYATWGSPGTPEVIQANSFAALKNATSQFGAVTGIFTQDRNGLGDKALLDTVIQQIQGRFIGSPQRNMFLANKELLLGNDKAAADLYRETIHLAPAFRESYLGLGKLAFQSGRAGEAASVYLSFPGLHRNDRENGVEIANTAYDMGSHFYNSGDFEYAIALYKIAAHQNSGSGGEMAAQMRLSILAGDLPGTLATAHERAQRYNDGRAYRDYMGILHATKHGQEAWSGFDALVHELQSPEIWETALVGHHMSGSSESDVLAWIKKRDLQGAGNHASYAANYLARFATTDRTPSKNLSADIDSVDRPVWQFEDGALSVVRVAADGREHQILGPVGAVSANGPTMVGMLNDPQKHRVRSQMSYFVEAYRAIKLHNYKDAKRIFDEAAALYDMAAPPSSFMLPYYAFAGAKAGPDVSAIEQILNRYPAPEQGFDYQLANAALQAVAGKGDAAVASLKLARYRRPNTEERPLLTQYTFGDMCELLFNATHNPRIRAEALDWARVLERIEPWQSWSYALEAGLATDPELRGRAIAMTYYLDPKSSHLSAYTYAEIQLAVQKFGSANVFLGNKSNERKGATST